MLSCDTMAIQVTANEYGQNMLAKNSDRPTAETQLLRFFPARNNPRGTRLQMTHLVIEDAQQTYAVIGSQPYWIWGFEMGFNECGLIIGNEAEGSKNDAEAETGILGMDLLRLALERAATAREAIDVITFFLERYGQYAGASQLIHRTYENAFLLVDQNEIWLLETAGREWVAKRVEDRLGISNCYTIGEDFDLCSKNLEKLARDRRWLAPDEPLHFAKAYTKITNRQTLAVPRMRRLNKLLNQRNVHNVATLKAILRDHFEGEITDTRFGKATGTFFSICMHMREWGDSETVASLISRIDPDLGVVSRFAPVQPCQSLYLPIYFTGYLPEKLSEGGQEFSERSLWWKYKRLSLLLALDESLEEGFAEKIADLEDRIESLAAEAEKDAKKLLRVGSKQEAHALLNATMDQALAITEQFCDDEYRSVSEKVKQRGGLFGPQLENIQTYCEYAKVPFENFT